MKQNLTLNLTYHRYHDKATKRLNILRMLKYKLIAKLLSRYILLSRPVLEYADVVWNNCSEKNALLLENTS